MKDRIETSGQQNENLSDEEFYERYLAGKKWPEECQTEEDHLLDEWFQEELEEEVKREMELQKQHPELEMEEPSPDLFERILTEAKKIEKEKTAEYRPEDYLTEEDRKALEIGRKRLSQGKRHKWIMRLAVNAAILVCVFMIGVSTEANRIKIVNVINTLVGKEALVRVNNETDREKTNNQQEEAYAAIENQLGIKPVRFMYEVKGMEFSKYEIDKKVQKAALFYGYRDTVLTVIMRQEERGTAKGDMPDGETGEIFDIQSGIGTIEAVEVKGELGSKYMSQFIYNNTYYYICGELPKEEYINLMSSIFF